ncbi:AAS bifunctional protein [Babesia caballi]|uniref:AAS bifunctional protein n=1 Tax=Babesia caballi TaxID=5871 RepID=A0AAV4M450_BABCB|nr:AAS bifunctional protein [Babesia caballi]
MRAGGCCGACTACCKCGPTSEKHAQPLRRAHLVHHRVLVVVHDVEGLQELQVVDLVRVGHVDHVRDLEEVVVRDLEPQLLLRLAQVELLDGLGEVRVGQQPAADFVVVLELLEERHGPDGRRAPPGGIVLAHVCDRSAGVVVGVVVPGRGLGPGGLHPLLLHLVPGGIRVDDLELAQELHNVRLPALVVDAAAQNGPHENLDLRVGEAHVELPDGLVQLGVGHHAVQVPVENHEELLQAEVALDHGVEDVGDALPLHVLVALSHNVEADVEPLEHVVVGDLPRLLVDGLQQPDGEEPRDLDAHELREPLRPGLRVHHPVLGRVVLVAVQPQRLLLVADDIGDFHDNVVEHLLRGALLRQPRLLLHLARERRVDHLVGHHVGVVRQRVDRLQRGRHVLLDLKVQPLGEYKLRRSDSPTRLKPTIAPVLPRHTSPVVERLDPLERAGHLVRPDAHLQLVEVQEGRRHVRPEPDAVRSPRADVPPVLVLRVRPQQVEDDAVLEAVRRRRAHPLPVHLVDDVQRHAVVPEEPSVHDDDPLFNNHHQRQLPEDELEEVVDVPVVLGSDLPREPVGLVHVLRLVVAAVDDHRSWVRELEGEEQQVDVGGIHATVRDVPVEHVHVPARGRPELVQNPQQVVQLPVQVSHHDKAPVLVGRHVHVVDRPLVVHAVPVEHVHQYALRVIGRQVFLRRRHSLPPSNSPPAPTCRRPAARSRTSWSPACPVWARCTPSPGSFAACFRRRTARTASSARLPSPASPFGAWT